MDISKQKLATLLFGFEQYLKYISARYQDFKKKLGEKDYTVQFKLKDGSVARYLIFKEGKIISHSGLHPFPEVTLIYKDADHAAELISPWSAPEDQVQAMKNSSIVYEGNDEFLSFFMDTLSLLSFLGTEYGVKQKNGEIRYVNSTPAGLIFVYVKDGKIIRCTPVELDDKDAENWKINARGKIFTPPRHTIPSASAYASKSLVYSSKRVLYPLKRKDFNPQTDRCITNRGITDYVPITWDEASTIIADEIKRIKSTNAPGAIGFLPSPRNNPGNIGHPESCHKRFFNFIGTTDIEFPLNDKAGWYWGAMHHWGFTETQGTPELKNTVEDALKNCEMMVFWSCDPETPQGNYASNETSLRLDWLKNLSIQLVHIDTYYNPTAAYSGGKWIAPRPGTDVAMALAIAYVWLDENIYDKAFIRYNTTGFENWEDYIYGIEDDYPKTPEWQEKETGIPAKDVRALAREWAAKKTYLAAGGIGCANSYQSANSSSIEWARAMVFLMAMRGFGKPGINFGCLQSGTPLDTSFFFPGYLDGGISGSIRSNSNSYNYFQRMPHLRTQNSAIQKIPAHKLPEAIIGEPCEGYEISQNSVQGQFIPYFYPAPGHSKIKMLWQSGTTFTSEISDANRMVKAFRNENLSFLVNQSTFLEGDACYADIILPVCTNFERWDIAEYNNYGGNEPESYLQNNHRIVHLQQKCIEPLGESKSDYNIYYEVSKKLGFAQHFSEGMTEFDWCRRIFESSDLPKNISWKKFLTKGYFVVPPMAENINGDHGEVAMSWLTELLHKNMSAPYLAGFKTFDSKKQSFETQSQKLEFVSQSLKNFNASDPERLPLGSRYIIKNQDIENQGVTSKYSFYLINIAPRFSYHTFADGKGSFINEIKEHRINIDGYFYKPVKINPKDAETIQVKDKQKIRLFNDNGSIIGVASISERIQPGTLVIEGNSAFYDFIEINGNNTDKAGNVQFLTSGNNLISKASASNTYCCYINIEVILSR